MQVSKAIGPFLNEEMIIQNSFLTLYKLRHMGKDKVSRARSIQARCRARTVFVDKEADWFANFEDEIIKFPRGRNDDQVDTFAYLGMLLDKLLEAKTDEEVTEEEYEDEIEHSGVNQLGRSTITGY
jgi:phage terminase large subunit-like protein